MIEPQKALCAWKVYLIMAANNQVINVFITNLLQNQLLVETRFLFCFNKTDERVNKTVKK